MCLSTFGVNCMVLGEKYEWPWWQSVSHCSFKDHGGGKWGHLFTHTPTNCNWEYQTVEMWQRMVRTPDRAGLTVGCVVLWRHGTRLSVCRRRGLSSLWVREWRWRHEPRSRDEEVKKTFAGRGSKSVFIGGMKKKKAWKYKKCRSEP